MTDKHHNDEHKHTHHHSENDGNARSNLNETNPVFPTNVSLDVEEGDSAPDSGNRSKHPGLIWAVIAIVAVAILCIAFAAAGDWMTPSQAERISQEEFEEQTVPEDLGSNEDPAATVDQSAK